MKEEERAIEKLSKIEKAINEMLAMRQPVMRSVTFFQSEILNPNYCGITTLWRWSLQNLVGGQIFPRERRTSSSYS